MPEITSIKHLVDCFKKAVNSERISVLKKCNLVKSDVEKFATWTEGGYTRNCVARDDEFEFILLCWDHGAKTPIHGHAGQDCWVYQVSGSVLEQRFVQVGKGFERTNEAVLIEGKISYMHDRMGYHTLENCSGKPAMTLHIYASPIDECEVYNAETERLEVRKMQYDSIHNDIRLKDDKLVSS